MRRDGIPVRLAVLLLCGAAWYTLQLLLYSLIPESETVFLTGGIVSLLAAVPLFLVAFLFPLGNHRLAGIRRAGLSLAVTAVIVVPFAVNALAGGLAWVYPGSGWVTTAAMLLLLAAAEEMVFRGFLMNILSFRGRAATGALLSSLLFALVHADNTGATPLGVLNVMVFGFLLALLRLASGGLAMPTVVHWAWNFLTGMVFGWKVSGYELPSLWGPSGGDPWGTFGPEGSPVLTLVLALCIVIVLPAARGASCDAREV